MKKQVEIGTQDSIGLEGDIKAKARDTILNLIKEGLIKEADKNRLFDLIDIGINSGEKRILLKESREDINGQIVKTFLDLEFNGD